MIKISDFGLSEDVFLRNYFREGLEGEEGVKLPVKWMAPESLSDGHFSERSDVVCYTHKIILQLFKSSQKLEYKPKFKNSARVRTWIIRESVHSLCRDGASVRIT